MVRIVDPDTRIECPEGTTGEIWVHGANVAAGYWQKPQETEQTFGATLVAASAGTPEGPWLRTGDLGFICDGELFIVGRIKDLLIVYGRNHSPDDLEATIQTIAPGRCAAISVPDDGTEKLVAIIELKNRAGTNGEAIDNFDVVKREVTSAISNVHGLSVADLVVVAAWFDSHHHERQGQTSSLCRALPTESVRPPGRLVVVNMLRTESERTLAAVRHRLYRNTFDFLCETHLELPPRPPPRCRTLVLFAHFDPQGIVDPYVAYYLKALHGLGATIVFVSGSPTLTPESVAPIRSLCAGIYTRRTLSLDFGSWHLAWCILRQRGWSLDHFDRFVIANDSVFGPLFPIEEMWSSFHDADMYGAIENTQMVPHLQSFFLAWDLNSRTRPFLNDFWDDFHTSSIKAPSSGGTRSDLSKRARKAGLSIKPFVSAAAIRTTYGSSTGASIGSAGAPGDTTAPFTSGTDSSRTSDSPS